MPATALNSATALLGANPALAFAAVESPSLRLAKFVRLEPDGKKAEIDAVIAAHTRHARRIPPVAPANALTFFATLVTRLIVNQAGGILENTGLCLHRHLGDPFIPGSAVKGIARHAAWLEWSGTSDLDEKSCLRALIDTVFGPENSTAAGTVAFLPAIPATAPRLVADITTCHHMKYYASADPKAVALDNEEPNVQPFLAVDAGVKFRFTLVPLRGAAPEILAAAKRWLINAITVSGAGAKTAAGYGWFIYDEAESQRLALAENDRLQRAAADAQFDKEKVALPNLDSLVPEALSPAVACVEAFLKKWAGCDGLQQIRDNLAANRRRLPQQSPTDALRERWATKHENEIIGSEIRQFVRKSEADKKAVVELLRENNNPIWTKLKTEPRYQKGDIAGAIAAIRAYCKNTLNLGKMP